jgi:50S ribosomal protein L16 3-hydroxylase
VLSEPKPGTWFTRAEASALTGGVVLDRRTRMLYDEDHVFINGASFRARGSDAKLMRRLADERGLVATEVRRLGAEARELLARWAEAGWCMNRGSQS